MSKITLNNVASFQNDTTAVASYSANNATLTTAFDNTLSRDGTSPNTMGANLDMNSNRILNLPAPASPLDPLRVQDLSSYTVTTANQITVPSSTTVGNVVTWNATNGLTLGTASNPNIGAATGTSLVLASPNAVLNFSTGLDSAFYLNKSSGTNWNYFQFLVSSVAKGAFGMDSSNNWFAGVYNPSFNQVLTITPAGATSFSGDVTWAGAAWSTWSPTVSSLTGTITSVGTVVARYKQLGKIVVFQISIPITNNGTGATGVLFTPPVTPNISITNQVISGFNINTSEVCGGYWLNSSSAFLVIKYNATYPVASGQAVSMSGTYEAA